MKKPMSKMKGGKATMEKPQGKAKGSGVNKAMPQPAIPQVVAKVRYGKPSQKQPLG